VARKILCGLACLLAKVMELKEAEGVFCAANVGRAHGCFGVRHLDR